MRFAKISFAVAAMSLALSTQARAFTAPSSLTPYLPVNCQATVTKVGGNATVSIYSIQQTGGTIAVSASASGAFIQQKANLSLAFFKLTQFDPAINTNMAERQAATVWFAANVAPLYPMPAASAAVIARPAVRR